MDERCRIAVFKLFFLIWSGCNVRDSDREFIEKTRINEWANMETDVGFHYCVNVNVQPKIESLD